MLDPLPPLVSPLPPMAASGDGRYLDPERVYTLYLEGTPEALVTYLDSFPATADDRRCQFIKELVSIPLRGHVPQDLQLKWHRKHAEYARKLATECRTGAIGAQEESR